jgi:hypothetical protein
MIVLGRLGLGTAPIGGLCEAVGCRTAEEVAENMRLSTLEIPDALWDELA